MDENPEVEDVRAFCKFIVGEMLKERQARKMPMDDGEYLDLVEAFLKRPSTRKKSGGENGVVSEF